MMLNLCNTEVYLFNVCSVYIHYLLYPWLLSVAILHFYANILVMGILSILFLFFFFKMFLFLFFILIVLLCSLDTYLFDYIKKNYSPCCFFFFLLSRLKRQTLLWTVMWNANYFIILHFVYFCTYIFYKVVVIM